MSLHVALGWLLVLVVFCVLAVVAGALFVLADAAEDWLRRKGVIR